MVVCLDAPVLAPLPAASGSGCASDGLPVALAFDHGHEWIQDEGLIGLFHCADSSCDAHAVCPGCLNCPLVALAAPAAGLVVYWCVLHVRGGGCDRRPARRGQERVTR